MTFSILGGLYYFGENKSVKNEAGAHEMMGRSPEEWQKGRRKTTVLLSSCSLCGLSVGTHGSHRTTVLSFHLYVSLGDGVSSGLGLHRRGRYLLSPLASPPSICLTAKAVFTPPLGHVWYSTIVSPDDINLCISLLPVLKEFNLHGGKRDVQAGSTQIYTLMVLHVLGPLHTEHGHIVSREPAVQ